MEHDRPSLYVHDYINNINVYSVLLTLCLLQQLQTDEWSHPR